MIRFSIYITHVHSFLWIKPGPKPTAIVSITLSLSLKPIWPSLLLFAWNGSFYDMEEAKARRRLSILCSHLHPLGASDSGHAPTHLISSRVSNSYSETENNKKNLHQNDCVFCKIIINESPSVKVIIHLNLHIYFFNFVKRKIEMWILRFFTIWVSNFEFILLHAQEEVEFRGLNFWFVNFFLRLLNTLGSLKSKLMCDLNHDGSLKPVLDEL